MVVNRPQAAHGSVSNVRAILSSNFLVTLDHKAWVIAEQSEWLVEPIDHQSFHMIAKILNCPFTSPLPLKVRLAISIPSCAQRGTTRTRFPGIATVNLHSFIVRCFLRSRV